MIVTLTLNPSLDRTLEVDALDRGAVLRGGPRSTWTRAAKGVNVTRALLANGFRLGAPVIPCGRGGGRAAGPAAGRRVGAHRRGCRFASRTRSNVTLVEPDGTVTKVKRAGGRR